MRLEIERPLPDADAPNYERSNPLVYEEDDEDEDEEPCFDDDDDEDEDE